MQSKEMDVESSFHDETESLHLTSVITSMITGHAKTKVYSHQFGIIDDPTFSCLEADLALTAK